jgi:sirohydrochlorin ferrochelatase
VKRAIVIVDHGSRKEAANAVVMELARALQARAGERALVAWAHMEGADPPLQKAIDACVSRGALEVTVQPLFLVPGKHATRDIPELLAAARRRHSHVRFELGQVIGADPLLLELIARRCAL